MLLFLCTLAGVTQAATEDEPGDEFFDQFENFEDAPLPEAITHPAWFKLSFLDLGDDLAEAVAHGKQGLIVYLGQKYCAYCRKLLENDFGKADIRTYTRKHFDVVGIDIHGQREVTDLNGSIWTERSFAVKQKVNFTPTLIFYDASGREALRLTGYYPPYKFRAALEYVADGYYRTEDFRTYLARAGVPLKFEAGDLNEEDFFSPPPHALDRSRIPGQRPLVVFFEQGDCHACDVLHSGPLRDADIRRRFLKMDATQLNMWSDTPVITPTGEHTTARKWADELGLFYAPTLIFFDERGHEILRVDSVVQFYRLKNVLDYILSGAYRRYPTFQQWRSEQHR
ncbi:MAG TPA: thioredoxin [Gammaproteobacteria bacterium]|nr:thioredoxin [Gammaproteobacteria bacterium]